MRKLAAILLLTIQLFNIGGVIALRQYMAYRTDKFYNEQAGNGKYNVNDLTEVTIPVNLPHITDWTAYENVSGQIQFEHTCYNYVKLKLTHNAIHLMCLPNYSQTRLTGQNVIHVKGLKDVPVPKKEHVPFVTGINVPHCFSFTTLCFQAPCRDIKALITGFVQASLQHQPDTLKQPPRYC